MRPAELGRLAPLVSRAAESGDPVADRITAAAVRGLLQTLATVYDGADAVDADTYRGTVVLAGSVLLQPGPISSGVRRAHPRPLGRPKRVTQATAPAAQQP